MHRRDKKIAYVIGILCGVILSVIGFPFAARYTPFEESILGYQAHSIVFLGSPIYSWSTWNAESVLLDYFIMFTLNTLASFAIIYLILLIKN